MLIDCKYYEDGNCTGGYWFNPNYDSCMNRCQHRIPLDSKKSKGLGDTVEKVINKVTRGKAKPCGGCKKRKKKLNKLIPYKDKESGN